MLNINTSYSLNGGSIDLYELKDLFTNTGSNSRLIYDAPIDIVVEYIAELLRKMVNANTWLKGLTVTTDPNKIDTSQTITPAIAVTIGDFYKTNKEGPTFRDSYSGSVLDTTFKEDNLAKRISVAEYRWTIVYTLNIDIFYQNPAKTARIATMIPRFLEKFGAHINSLNAFLSFDECNALPTSTSQMGVNGYRLKFKLFQTERINEAYPVLRSIEVDIQAGIQTITALEMTRGETRYDKIPDDDVIIVFSIYKEEDGTQFDHPPMLWYNYSLEINPIVKSVALEEGTYIRWFNNNIIPVGSTYYIDYTKVISTLSLTTDNVY